MNADSGPSFNVDWSLIREQLRKLIEEAGREGSNFKARFGKAMKEVQEELRGRPLDWGEPLYDLKKIRLTVCIGFRAGLMVR